MVQLKHIGLCLFAVCALAFQPGIARAQQASVGEGISPAVQMELDYARKLQEVGMADYAEIVLSKIQDPSIGPMLKVAKLQNFLVVGKFAEAEAIIKKEPDPNSANSWAMKLAMADAKYAWNKYAEAQAIYDEFFKKYQEAVPPALKRFYIESAYKYIQMLLMLGKHKEALKQYDIALKAKPDKNTTRMLIAEQADILLKLYETATTAEKTEYEKQIQKIAGELYWVQDVWFGKAVVLDSHLKMLQGDVAGAQNHIKKYTEQLLQIDEALKKEELETGEPLSKLSPMAQCRYQLGKMMMDEAEKLKAAGGDKNKIIGLLVGTPIPQTKNRTSGALQHFLEVFVGYPTTSWAPDAGIRAQKVEDMILAMGGKIKKNITKEQWEKVEKSQLSEARVLYNQNQFDAAAEQYIKVLNLFPESETTIQAQSELAKCFSETGDLFASEAVAKHISERYSKKKKMFTKAGEITLTMAAFYDGKKMNDARDAMYDMFINLYTAHPKASDLIMYVGEQKLKDGQTKEALAYFDKAATAYADKQVGLDALGKMAAAYAQATNITAEIETLKRIIDNLEKKQEESYLYVNSKFRYAGALKKMDPAKNNVTALNLFTEVGKLITEKKTKIAKTEFELAGLDDIGLAVAFNKALCYSQIKKPEEKLNEYKAAALKFFQQVADSNVKSNKYASMALSQIGTLHSILGNPAEAEKALKTLKDKYPESPEAKMIDYVLANNLLKMGKAKEATEAFKKMMGQTDKYSEGQIAKAANELFDVKEFEIAGLMYQNTLSRAKETNLITMASVGLGKTQCELQKYDESIATLEGVLVKNPKTGYAVIINDYLRRAYTEKAVKEPDLVKRIELFNKAVKSMKMIKKYLKSPEEKVRVDLGIAQITEYKARSEKEFGDKEKAQEYMDEAIASYQIIIDNSSPTNIGAEVYYDEAFLKGNSMLAEVEKWDIVLDNCELYLKSWPKGKQIMAIRSMYSKAKVNASPDRKKEEVVEGAAAPVEDLSVDEDEKDQGSAEKKPAVKPAEEKKEAAPEAAKEEAEKAKESETAALEEAAETTAPVAPAAKTAAPAAKATEPVVPAAKTAAPAAKVKPAPAAKATAPVVPAAKTAAPAAKTAAPAAKTAAPAAKAKPEAAAVMKAAPATAATESKEGESK